MVNQGHPARANPQTHTFNTELELPVPGTYDPD
jgi:hypothetical protein